MKADIESGIVRDVQADLARAQESLGVPEDERQTVPEKAVRSILKVIHDNDEALRFLARC